MHSDSKNESVAPTTKHGRSRSIRFADEKEEEQFMLETILLFEPDPSFNDSSIVEAVMEDFHDSHSSFDSWEYAHNVNGIQNNQLHRQQLLRESGGHELTSTLQELEQEVREQQAHEKIREDIKRNMQTKMMAKQKSPSKTSAIASSSSSSSSSRGNVANLSTKQPDKKEIQAKPEIPQDIFLSDILEGSFSSKNGVDILSPEDQTCTGAAEELSNNTSNISHGDLTTPVALPPGARAGKLSSKREQRKTRHGNLQLALEKSISLRMLEETTKARKLRVQKNLKDIEAKMAREQQKVEEQRKKDVDWKRNSHEKPQPVRRFSFQTKTDLSRIDNGDDKNIANKEQHTVKEQSTIDDEKIVKDFRAFDTSPQDQQQQQEENKRPQPVRRRPSRTKSALERMRIENEKQAQTQRQQEDQPESNQQAATSNEAGKTKPARRRPSRTKSDLSRFKRDNTNQESSSTETSAIRKTHTAPISSSLLSPKIASTEVKSTEQVENKKCSPFTRRNSVPSVAARFDQPSAATITTTTTTVSTAQLNAQSAKEKRLSELKGISGTKTGKNCTNVSSATQNARTAQQRRLLELERITAGTKNQSNGEVDRTSSAYRNAQLAHKRRFEEVNVVKGKSIVGSNTLSKRERLIVELQAAARGFLTRLHLKRDYRYEQATRLQALVRGYCQRRHITAVKANIASLEQHLCDMERAKQAELAAILDSSELRSLQDQMSDASQVVRIRAIEEERKVIRTDIASIKADTSQIEKWMENLRINNKKIAKTTREIEWQSSKLESQNAMLKKTQQHLLCRAQKWKEKVSAINAEICELIRKAQLEHSVGNIAHHAILQIRTSTKLAAETSTDPFLVKVRTRSKLLDRISDEKKRIRGSTANAIRPVQT